MLLIYSNPESWAGLSAAQREGLARSHEELSRELTEQGMLVSAAGLADPITTRTVSVRDDTRTTTDGPYAEAKEHLAGFYLVECDDIDQAIEYAARIPDAKYLAVEVRPVMDNSGLEM
ncbi:YciI family protein [Kribbella sp. CA-293567]|uniref:YciI family protein n=1 Tax=Kribbella sp. CA-293567 TaxID=3002436 RepID=UPI0022DD1340|nr:YciI family protein [Kribbella sp. CA-293567]WBQ08733.1 YciI family protein [Kribbella sp. CA-293567]